MGMTDAYVKGLGLVGLCFQVGDGSTTGSGMQRYDGFCAIEVVATSVCPQLL